MFNNILTQMWQYSTPLIILPRLKFYMCRFSDEDCSRSVEYLGIFLLDGSEVTSFTMLRILKKMSNVLVGN
ncbi:hypothetical protein ECSE_0580 [Escherichia coli SE11]|nr:hypothetical protein ECSE_0580 [Escherichia coli SE11]